MLRPLGTTAASTTPRSSLRHSQYLNHLIEQKHGARQRLVRPMMLSFTAARAGQARLWLNRDYVEHIELQHIDPEPEKVEVLPDRLLYIFNVPNPARPTAVTYYFEANAYGHLPLRVGLEAGPQLAVSQFYYP